MKRQADIIPSKLSHIFVRRELRHVPLASDHGGARVGAARQWSSLHVLVSILSSLCRVCADHGYNRLNFSSKALALIGAALLLLDFAATSVVSAATAISYLAGEVTLPFPAVVGTLVILSIFTIISLSGLRESARVALVLLSIHVCPIFNLRNTIVLTTYTGSHYDSPFHCLDYRLVQKWQRANPAKLGGWPPRNVGCVCRTRNLQRSMHWSAGIDWL